MMSDDKFRIGVISSTHGLKGEVKVFPTTEDVKRFSEIEEVYLDTGKEELLLKIQSVRYFKQFAIVKFEGIDNINDVEKYKGMNLLVTRDHAVPLDEDEYYVADLMDLKVILEDGTEFGKLTDVMETGANDVYVVTRTEGSEVLLPAIKQCIKNIDMDKRTMTIHLMDGLI
ncbi:MAG: ribosome maturation factor RimM [Lachnospiraceae bacterium]|nr:ribosome maturation factor RimM [Lachnospiraceae bacterium]MDD3614886.1 ribosome maturation factor RimM [Lachnospiraceae bacterium]